MNLNIEEASYSTTYDYTPVYAGTTYTPLDDRKEANGNMRKYFALILIVAVLVSAAVGYTAGQGDMFIVGSHPPGRAKRDAEYHGDHQVQKRSIHEAYNTGKSYYESARKATQNPRAAFNSIAEDIGLKGEDKEIVKTVSTAAILAYVASRRYKLIGGAIAAAVVITLTSPDRITPSFIAAASATIWIYRTINLVSVGMFAITGLIYYGFL